MTDIEIRIGLAASPAAAFEIGGGIFVIGHADGPLSVCFEKYLWMRDVIERCMLFATRHRTSP